MKKINEQLSPHEEVKKFNNHEEAKEWLKKEFKFWRENRLKKDEEKAFENYSNPKNIQYQKEIGDYLKTTDGKLVDKKDLAYNALKKTFNDIDKMNKDIPLLDEGIDRSKLPETVFAYQRYDEEFFNLPKGAFRNNNPEQGFSEAIFKQIHLKYTNKFFVETRYGDFHLTKDSHNKHLPILVETKLPKNSKAAYFDNGKNSKEEDFKIMIPRNQKFLINRISMINEEGVKTLKVEMNLLDNY